MTKLLQCLRDELVRRDYAATTIRSYIQIVEAFRQHTGARLDRLTPAQLRRYHLFLLEDRRLADRDGSHADLRAAILLPVRVETSRRA